MCRKSTYGSAWLAFGFALASVTAAMAQSRPDWRKIGTSAVELMLASPVTGPVDRVWFSPDGSELYARTASGKTFVTIDFETWTAALGSTPPAPSSEARVARLPDATARLITSSADPSRLYAVGQQLSRSEDGGLT